MPKQRQPYRIVHTASGRKLRSDELRRMIWNLVETFPRLTNMQIAKQLGVSRTTVGKYAVEMRRLPKPEGDLPRIVKMLWNADATNPAEIAMWLEEHYGYKEISSNKVRRILDELRQQGKIRNEYADSTKIVYDRGKKREIKEALNIEIYNELWQAFRYEDREAARKRELKLRYAGSTSDAREKPAQRIRRKSARPAEKRRRKSLPDRKSS